MLFLFCFVFVFCFFFPKNQGLVNLRGGEKEKLNCNSYIYMQLLLEAMSTVLKQIKDVSLMGKYLTSIFSAVKATGTKVWMNTMYLTSVLVHPICAKGHGPSTPSQSPKTGSWWSVNYQMLNNKVITDKSVSGLEDNLFKIKQTSTYKA